MNNSPEEAKYYAIKYLLDDEEGFYPPEIIDGKFIFKDDIQRAIVESKGITQEHILRYIKEKESEGQPVEIDKEALELAKEKEKLEGTFKDIKKILSDYLDIAESQKTIIALWIIGTHIHKEFETYPYLFLNAMRGSGKTRTLKIITALSKDGQLLASLTEAVLFRTTGMLAIDEFESLGSKDKQALRELLNASYKKGVKIIRMRKKKSIDGEEQVAEQFEPYRPITMANIWGIEEVLGDRCISLILEKSDKEYYTKMIEDFTQNPTINKVKTDCTNFWCSLCSVVMKKNIISTWNNYIKNKYVSTLSTLTTLTTDTTLNTFEEEKEQDYGILDISSEDLSFCNRIDATGLDGRHLELYFPLFLIAKAINEDIFEETLTIAKNMVHERKMDEVTESKDVLIYKLVKNCDGVKFYKISELTSHFKLMMGEGEADWLNSKWVGRALKRLNLVVDRRRTSDGIEVTLNITKAEEKLKMFDKQ